MYLTILDTWYYCSTCINHEVASSLVWEWYVIPQSHYKLKVLEVCFEYYPIALYAIITLFCLLSQVCHIFLGVQIQFHMDCTKHASCSCSLYSRILRIIETYLLTQLKYNNIYPKNVTFIWT